MKREVHLRNAHFHIAYLLVIPICVFTCTLQTIIGKISNFKMLLNISKSERGIPNCLKGDRQAHDDAPVLRQFFAAKSLSYSTIKKLINLN